MKSSVERKKNQGMGVGQWVLSATRLTISWSLNVFPSIPVPGTQGNCGVRLWIWLRYHQSYLRKETLMTFPHFKGKGAAMVCILNVPPMCPMSPAWCYWEVVETWRGRAL
jgi:hypothetical protein